MTYVNSSFDDMTCGVTTITEKLARRGETVVC